MSTISISGPKKLAVDLLFDLVGCLLYAVGVQSFSAPFQLPPGGVTGISMLITHLIDLPISAVSFAINIPLLAVAFFVIGRRFTLRTLQSVLILTAMFEISLRFIPTYGGDVMLAALFGGVLQGAGLALVFMRGSTTGGVDILSRLIQGKFPHLSMGRLILVMDALILLGAAIIYESPDNAMYAMVMVFVTSKVIDGIIFGLDSGRMILIISDFHQTISNEIHEIVGRGSTLLHGTGTYTGENRPVLVCAVSTQEFHSVKDLIYRIDPAAFVMTLETDEVLGEGFKPLKPTVK